MSSKKRILVAEDEPGMRRILEVAFEKAGYTAHCVPSAEAALKELANHHFSCVLTDVTMPGMDGHQLQVIIAEQCPDLPIIVMTAYGTIPDAVKAIRGGAYEYITKPFDLDQLRKIVKSATESPTIRQSSQKQSPKSAFIAESPEMKEVLETIRQVADSKATVLITGESGTGKEVVANLLHEQSSRANGPFIACSCAALPETLLESELFGYEKGAFTGAQGSKVGRFEAAHGGTLFLDEIGEVPLGIQAKLLRVIQEREFERLGATKTTKVDVRLVTATNRNLEEEVKLGTFRLDLLYRLQVIEIALPALRERPSDILPLAKHFLARVAADNERKGLELGAPVEKLLLEYSWPGNVRELGNAIERAVVLAPASATELAIENLPRALKAA
ncbi:MAG: sigma-54-dependent Fis family transcriptional regulator [Armatimonadetes bacterium]|nr:sigma-54-dependent Fis family transcriptional regulator [Armatimonadota bacterium]